jgi:hypothetical protein
LKRSIRLRVIKNDPCVADVTQTLSRIVHEASRNQLAERGEHTRLAIETRYTVGIARAQLREDLQRDIVPQPGIPARQRAWFRAQAAYGPISGQSA